MRRASWQKIPNDEITRWELEELVYLATGGREQFDRLLNELLWNCGSLQGMARALGISSAHLRRLLRRGGYACVPMIVNQTSRPALIQRRRARRIYQKTRGRRGWTGKR